MPKRWRELAQADVSYQRMSMTSGRPGDERQVELVQMALPHVPLGAMEPLAPLPNSSFPRTGREVPTSTPGHPRPDRSRLADGDRCGSSGSP